VAGEKNEKRQYYVSAVLTRRNVILPFFIFFSSHFNKKRRYNTRVKGNTNVNEKRQYYVSAVLTELPLSPLYNLADSSSKNVVAQVLNHFFLQPL
jgi:hypothetical protein